MHSTEKGKAIVGEIRYRKLQEAIALAQKLADTENAAVVVKRSECKWL